MNGLNFFEIYPTESPGPGDSRDLPLKIKNWDGIDGMPGYFFFSGMWRCMCINFENFLDSRDCLSLSVLWWVKFASWCCNNIHSEIHHITTKGNCCNSVNQLWKSSNQEVNQRSKMIYKIQFLLVVLYVLTFTSNAFHLSSSRSNPMMKPLRMAAASSAKPQHLRVGIFGGTLEECSLESFLWWLISFNSVIEVTYTIRISIWIIAILNSHPLDSPITLTTLYSLYSTAS